MCGIYGIIYHDTSRKVHEEMLLDMGRVISHRGPDNLGVYAKNNVGLGHTRLSIIDLSKLGSQPMSNEDGTVWVTFNGEIYNFPEIKDYLLKKGHQFRSHTDTEVLVHLWEEEGTRSVLRLSGMFAFAVWDQNQETLFLARDRAGKKPLFYTTLHDRFAFGSEIKSILQDPDFKSEPDVEAIHHYLALQSVPAPYSAFKGIKCLPPAHYLLFKNNKISGPVRYWKLSYKDKLRINSENDISNLQVEIIERLKEAIKIRLMSDVPLGAFLSGGLDSSIVTALMAGLVDEPVKTFSIGFEHDEYNELPYARIVADRYKTDHYEFIVKPDAKAIFPELVWHYNQPFADTSAIPTYYVCQMAKKYVTVILTGDGGDENFAGYSRYTNEGEFAVKNNFRSFFKRCVQKSMMGAFYGSGLWNNINRLKSLTQERLLYYYRISHFHELYKALLYTPGMKKRNAGSLSVDILLEKYRQSDASDFLDSTLGLDFELYLPDTLMTKTDVASMVHALETRCPLLDHKFMEFAAKIPSYLKLKDGHEGKYILKKAVEPYLPPEIIYRKKMGFGVPLDHWFRKELKDMVYDTLLSRRAIERDYFRKEYIQDMLDRHQNGENWQYHIWNLLMLELWHLMFIDRTLSPPPSGSLPL